jgi:hypothetical protein
LCDLRRYRELFYFLGWRDILDRHNMGAVASLCSPCLLLTAGTKAMDGVPENVISHYLDQGMEAGISLRDRTDRRGNGAARFVECVTTR